MFCENKKNILFGSPLVWKWGVPGQSFVAVAVAVFSMGQVCTLELQQIRIHGLWIRILFLCFRIELFFSMRIRNRIKPLFYCGSGSSVKKFVTSYIMKTFLKLKATKKIAQILKTMKLVLIYLHVFHTITITTDFFTVFLFFPSNFSLLYPDP